MTGIFSATAFARVSFAGSALDQNDPGMLLQTGHSDDIRWIDGNPEVAALCWPLHH
jgi:hypothetical protein